MDFVELSLVLHDVGPRRIEVMKAVRVLNPGLSPAAAKQLIEVTPVVIHRTPWLDRMNEIGLELLALEAEVTILFPDNGQEPPKVMVPELEVPMEIPPAALAALRGAGLLLSEPDSHGVSVAKPRHVPGNSLPDYESHWDGRDGVIVDTPVASLFGKNERWFVEVLEYVPGPGPGDFLHEYAQVEEAVADVLDYFFGDPSRMQLCRDYQRPTPEEAMGSDRTDEPCRVPGCSDQRVTFSAFCPDHHDQMLRAEL